MFLRVLFFSTNILSLCLCFVFVQRLENRLSRCLTHLSTELYGQPGHFFFELIQNADDNLYAADTPAPHIHFRLGDSDLVVANNEAVGFSEDDVRALCDVGVSTKVAQRSQKTGQQSILPNYPFR